MPEDAPKPRTLVAAIVVAVLSVSTAAVLIRASDAPPLVIAFYRLFFATVILGAVAAASRESRRALADLSRRDWLALSGVGVVLALHFATWITSLGLTTVAASVVLVTLHPVFVGLVSGRLFGEPLPAAGYAGALVALAGGGVIGLGDSREGAAPLLGDALALVGAVAAAAYFLAGRNFRRRLPLLAYVVPVYAASTLALLLMALVAGDPLTGYSSFEFGLFVALAVVPMILGHTLLNFALRYVTAPVIATTILGEPVGSTILAYMVFQEIPSGFTFAGGALVLAGIAVVVLADRRARRSVAKPS